jgi:hypothetical protein
VCYEDGKTTGQLTLHCSHSLCLGCYTRLEKRTCPMCRDAIRTGEPARVLIRLIEFFTYCEGCGLNAFNGTRCLFCERVSIISTYYGR